MLSLGTDLVCIQVADVQRPLEEAVPTAAAINQSAVSSPEAKTSRLLPEQEQILLRFFGAQDKVDREEALALANQVCLCIMHTVAFRSHWHEMYGV